MSFRQKSNSIDKKKFYYKGYILTLHNLTKEQEAKLERAVELYRKVYNWTIDTSEEYYHKYKNDPTHNNGHLSDKEFQRKLSDYRNQNKWLKEIGLGTARNAMFDALDAYKNWFNKSRPNKKPKHKKKKVDKKQFSPRSEIGKFYIKDNMVCIEKIGKLDIGYHTGLKRSDKIKYSNPRVFKGSDGKWRVSYTIFTPKVKSINYNYFTNTYTPSYDRAIGIDLNKKKLIVTSYMDGEIYELPDTVDKYYNKYKELKKQVVRDIKLTKRRHPEITNWEEEDLSEYKSNNAIKRQIKCNKARLKVANILNTYVHTIAKKIITRYPKAIIMENMDLHTLYSIKQRAGRISYIPFYNIKAIFQNKCDKYNVPFIQARRDYPSTQRCSCCGSRKKMDGKHTYICPVCGNVMDRDINAAFNLEQYYNYTDALVWNAA